MPARLAAELRRFDKILVRTNHKHVSIRSPRRPQGRMEARQPHQNHDGIIEDRDSGATKVS